MSDYWCSFAKFGDPNLSGKNNPEWKPYSADGTYTVEINEHGIYNVNFEENKLVKYLTDTELNRLEM